MALAGSTLAERIREIRVRQLAATQREFAGRLHTRTNDHPDPALISRWERGVEPSLFYLRQIAKLAGVTVAQLYGENGKVAA